MINMLLTQQPCTFATFLLSTLYLSYHFFFILLRAFELADPLFPFLLTSKISPPHYLINSLLHISQQTLLTHQPSVQLKKPRHITLGPTLLNPMLIFNPYLIY